MAKTLDRSHRCARRLPRQIVVAEQHRVTLGTIWDGRGQRGGSLFWLRGSARVFVTEATPVQQLKLSKHKSVVDFETVSRPVSEVFLSVRLPRYWAMRRGLCTFCGNLAAHWHVSRWSLDYVCNRFTSHCANIGAIWASAVVWVLVMRCT